MSEKWLIVGGSGMLGQALSHYLVESGRLIWATAKAHPIEVNGVSTVPLDLAEDFDPRAILDAVAPDVVAYVAGLTDVDKCEANEPLAERLHATAAGQFALKTAGRCRFIYISTDHLWDGTKANVSEDEPLQTLNAYARTKATGEAVTLDANPDALVLRTNFFGDGLKWRKSISDWMLERMRAGETLNAFVDAFFTPIAMPLLSSTISAAVSADLRGIFHCCGAERISKFEFAHRLAMHFGYDTAGIAPALLSEAALKAPRPLDMSLSTQKLERALGKPLPSLSQSFEAAWGAAVDPHRRNEAGTRR